MNEHFFIPESLNPTQKRNKVVITPEELEAAKLEYFAGGGTITKIATEDKYYNTFPVKSDNYTSSKGSINGSTDYVL